MEDKEILDLFFGRDERAISHTDEKYGESLRLTSRRITGSTQESEECVNDTYFRVWNSVPPDRPERFLAYLLKKVRNLSLNRLKYLKAKKRGGGELPLVLDELSQCIPDRFSTEQEADKNRLAEILDGFLTSLPEEKAVMFLQRYFYLCSIREIADENSISQSKVKMTLLRLRASLKNLLIKEGIEV